MTLAKRIWGLLLELVAPSECAACDATPINDLGLCSDCCATLDVSDGIPMRVAGVPVIAPLAYTGAVVAAIHRLKYGDRPDLARPLAAVVARCLGRAGLAIAQPNRADERATLVLVPVPLHPRRLAERGYNQSALLARELARRSGARVHPRLLRRIRDTPKQASLRGSDRADNVAGAFAIRRGGVARDRRLILVDDVVTTGATAAQCVAALREAGEHVVAVVAIARAGRALPQPAT